MSEAAPPARGTGRASRHLPPSITVVVVALLALAAGACTGGAPAGSPGAATASAATPSASAASAASAPTSLVAPNPTPVTDPRMVPASVIDAAKADAASQAGVALAGVTVVSADAIDWPSGALGCPKPGFLYTDVITPGYRIVVEAGGHRYDYRATARDGSVRWCENPPPIR